ncbi:MAG: DMT family transporter, partial [Planctomycetota bacterium]
MPPIVSLLIGVLACSTAVIWIKLSSVDSITLVALRLAIAGAVLLPWAIADWRRRRGEMSWTHLRDAALPGVVFAAHLITWNWGIRQTFAANGTLIVNLNPIVTPVLLMLLAGERVTTREVKATLLAVAGLVILFVNDYRLSGDSFRGDLICFGSMLLMSVYLTLAKRFRHHPTTLLYVTPLYLSAAVVAACATPWAAANGPLDWRYEVIWVLVLAFIPTLLGHSMLNQAMRRLRGQVVSLVNMTQFVFAAVLAWLV